VRQQDAYPTNAEGGAVTTFGSLACLLSIQLKGSRMMASKYNFGLL